MMNAPAANAEGVSMDMADACFSGFGYLSRRAKLPPAEGDMNAYSLRSSAAVRTNCQLPLAAMRERFARVAPMVVWFLICACIP